MIFDTANLQSRAFVFSRDAANIRPNSIFNFRINPSLTIFRAENKMIKKRCICISHYIQLSLTQQGIILRFPCVETHG